MDQSNPGDVAAPPEGDATETDRGIDELVADSHLRTPREECGQHGAIYARYSTKSQSSICDQVRSVLDAAARLKIHVPREHVYYDEAVRGCKRNRPGLDRLLEAVRRRGAVQAVLIFATNRLARQQHRALQIVHEEFVGRDVRCVFPSNGIDTADGHAWQILLQINSLVDQLAVASSAAHVRAAHEAMFDRRLVHGAVTYGYRGRAIGEGPHLGTGRPPREYEIDPEAARRVLRVFEWHARDGLSIGEIARRLNDEPQAPRNSRLLAGWTHSSIRRLLGNERYRGMWEYGRHRAVWLAGKDYNSQVRRDAPLRAARWDELRIVPDDLWLASQALLAAHDRRAAGRKPRDGDRRSRPKALAGLFYCAEHGRRMYAGGCHGAMLICKDCQATLRDRRPLCSILNRRLALKLTCGALADRIRRDDCLTSAIVAACRSAASSLQAPDPARVEALRARVKSLTNRIEFVMANPGSDDRDLRESKATLQKVRRERAELESELARIEADAARSVEVPDEDIVREMLSRLGAILDQAAGGGDAAEDREVRKVVDELTGGRIELHQMGGREPKRGWLQGRFLLRIPGLPAGAATPGAWAEVLIDYREPAPFEVRADEAKRLYDEGLLVKEIARRLGTTRNLTAKALDHWHRLRGLEPPDGRSRRWTLAPGRTSLAPPLFLRLADEALRLCDEGLLFKEVAARLGCNRDTAAKAARHAAASRSLAIPDGRTRRKALGRSTGRPARPRPDAVS